MNEPTPTTVQTTVPTPTTVLTTAPEVEATSSEISIALAFFDARNAYDVEAATALFNPDAHYLRSGLHHRRRYVPGPLRLDARHWLAVDGC